jgi:hypothetical protein
MATFNSSDRFTPSHQDERSVKPLFPLMEAPIPVPLTPTGASLFVGPKSAVDGSSVPQNSLVSVGCSGGRACSAFTRPGEVCSLPGADRGTKGQR